MRGIVGGDEVLARQRHEFALGLSAWRRASERQTLALAARAPGEWLLKSADAQRGGVDASDAARPLPALTGGGKHGPARCGDVLFVSDNAAKARALAVKHHLQPWIVSAYERALGQRLQLAGRVKQRGGVGREHAEQRR